MEPQKQSPKERPDKSVEEQIRYQELRKIRAEADKLEAEKKEIAHEWGWPLFFRKHLPRAVPAVLIAFPLLWFYVTEVALPLFSTENIQLARQNELVRDSLDSVEESLSLEIARLQIDSLALAQQKEDLDSLYADLSQEVRRLSRENSLTQAQSQRLRRRADSLAAVPRTVFGRALNSQCPCFDGAAIQQVSSRFNNGIMFSDSDRGERSQQYREVLLANTNPSQAWTIKVDKRGSSFSCLYYLPFLEISFRRENISPLEAEACREDIYRHARVACDATNPRERCGESF